MPAKAGIQYAAANRLDVRRLWNTGSPAFAGDDSRVGVIDPTNHFGLVSAEISSLPSAPVIVSRT
jgi:hypothetical protein